MESSSCNEQARHSRRRRARPRHQLGHRRGDDPRPARRHRRRRHPRRLRLDHGGRHRPRRAARRSTSSAASISAAARTSASRAPTRPRIRRSSTSTIDSLLRLGVSQLVTIGGDDTAFSAMKLEERAAGRIRVVHVPKTIDNDLDLPPHVDTFGFQTARHYGVEIVKNLMVDAKTTSRWYFVIAMGRKAGHLALGIGKAAGATTRSSPRSSRRRSRLKTIVDTLTAAIIKRLADGRRDGVAVIAEGVALDIAPEDIEGLAERRARRARPHAPGRGRPRRHPQGAGHGRASRRSASRRRSRQEHRLRAALRRSDPVRHGVHARPRLLRREVPASRAATPRWCRCRAATSSPCRSRR